MSVGVRLALLGAWGSVVVSNQVAAAEVEGIRMRSGPEATRVVLDLTGPAEHKLFTLSGPDRIVIDLPGTRAASALRMPESKGVVGRVRTGSRGGGELRVVLDLDRRVKPKSFLLPPDGGYGHRLVVDLEPVGAAGPVRRVPAATGSGRDLVIAIDAGHGGKDPGAPGRRGADEKHVVLAVARLLAEELEREPGLKPVLTRNGDYYVGHQERMEIAHRAQADLFVSIHIDSYKDASARGATVYALSTKRASDEVGRRVAERENAADLIGGVSLADKDDVLARVLLDLSQNASISASIAAGRSVIDALGGVTTLRKTDVQQAPFVVLTSPDIPSILIETAYISNPNEEAALNDARHQRSLARALREGIVEYFRENPLPGTYLADNPPSPSTPVRHVIRRGETLSEIAERYRVSLATLRRSNGLSGDVIRIGQVLTIPRT